MKMNPRKIEVEDAPGIHEVLVGVFGAENRPEIIIESGTYLGTGTTRRVIDAVLEVKPDPMPFFYTIEADYNCWKKANENLRDYKWVLPCNGFSLFVKEAVCWIRNDPMLKNPNYYPNIYVDTDPNSNLSAFYEESIVEMVKDELTEDVLGHLIGEYKDSKRIMFVLDSNGGIGFLEFCVVVREMGDRGFYLFLDDAHDHIKHVRSGRIIKENIDKRWRIIFTNERIMIAERLAR